MFVARLSQQKIRSFSMIGVSSFFVSSLVFGLAPQAQGTPRLLPEGQTLYGVGYDTPQVGVFDLSDRTVEMLPQTVGDAGGAEGAGFDPFTEETWIMQECELFTLNADGSVNSTWPAPILNSVTMTECWGFVPIGDGTAYMTGRLGSGQSEDNRLIHVSLVTGSVLTAPLKSTVDSTTLDPTTQNQIPRFSLEPVDLAYSSRGDLWVSAYDGYFYRLNPTSGVIDLIYDGFTRASEWTWGMAFDANDVLWAFMGDPASWDTIVSLEPYSNWARSDYPEITIAGTQTLFNSDALWVSGTPTSDGSSVSGGGSSGSGSVQSLADTGSKAPWLPLSGVTLLALGASGFIWHRMRSRRTSAITP